jgi:hypothetical protein
VLCGSRSGSHSGSDLLAKTASKYRVRIGSTISTGVDLRYVRKRRPRCVMLTPAPNPSSVFRTLAVATGDDTGSATLPREDDVHSPQSEKESREGYLCVAHLFVSNLQRRKTSFHKICGSPGRSSLHTR